MMANSIRRTAGVTATAAAVALGLAACGAAQEAGGDGDGNLLEQLQDEGSITVAFAGEIPYSWETEDGELTGATIALDREIYAAMGIDEVERSEEHTSELQSRGHLVCRLLLEKKKNPTIS